MKIKIIGYNRRFTFEPFNELVFKVRYQTLVRGDKIIHYWKEKGVIQKETYSLHNFHESYPVKDTKA